MAGTVARAARRALPGLIAAAALAGCGGGDEPASETEAVAEMLRTAATAAGEADTDKACEYLSDRARAQVVLRTGGRLGNVDCSAAVGRALLFLGPDERRRIGELQPTDIRLAGGSGTAVMRSPATQQNPIVAGLSVAKEGDDWKIAGFADDPRGL